MFSTPSVQSISRSPRKSAAHRRARRARRRESAGSRGYSSGIKLQWRHLEFHELSPQDVWLASAPGPFLIRHRDELLDELAGLGPRLVEGMGTILQGEALASAQPFGQLDLGALMAPASDLQLQVLGEDVRSEFIGMRRRLTLVAVAVSEAVARAAETGSAEAVLRAAVEVIEAWYDPASLARLMDFVSKHGPAGPRVPILEPDQRDQFAGWRMGGPPAWLAFAAHVGAELELGPRHHASVEVGGIEAVLAPMVTKLLGAEFYAARHLQTRIDVTAPIWDAAGRELERFRAGEPVGTAQELVAVAEAEPAFVEEVAERNFSSVEEVASVLGVAKNTLYGALQKHQRVPGVVRIGSRKVIDLAAFLRAVDRGDVDLG